MLNDCRQSTSLSGSTPAWGSFSSNQYPGVPFPTQVPSSASYTFEGLKGLAHPSSPVVLPLHPVSTLTAAHQPGFGLYSVTSALQLAGPSLDAGRPGSMPMHTADTYRLAKGSFGQLATWPQMPAIVSDSRVQSGANGPTADVVPAFTTLSGAVKMAGVNSVGNSIGVVSHANGTVGNDSGSMGDGNDDASSVDSDPEALVEDALLGELFFHSLQEQHQVRVLSWSWISL